MNVVASSPEGLEKSLAEEISTLGGFNINTNKRFINYDCDFEKFHVLSKISAGECANLPNVEGWHLACYLCSNSTCTIIRSTRNIQKFHKNIVCVIKDHKKCNVT